METFRNPLVFGSTKHTYIYTSGGAIICIVISQQEGEMTEVNGEWLDLNTGQIRASLKKAQDHAGDSCSCRKKYATMQGAGQSSSMRESGQVKVQTLIDSMNLRQRLEIALHNCSPSHLTKLEPFFVKEEWAKPHSCQCAKLAQTLAGTEGFQL